MKILYDSAISNKTYCGVHAGGKWGTNRFDTGHVPQDYLDYLKKLNVNSVGLSVGLFVENSMDSIVKTREDLDEGTFSEDELKQYINTFHEHGIDVYLTLAFEDNLSVNSKMPCERWMLGDPYIPIEDSNVKIENWPWSLDHKEHSSFIKQFFETYTIQARRFAKLAEQNGVKLFSLGTETDRLFRTTQGGKWNNDFKTELQKMVSEVRGVYQGQLTYDMLSLTITNDEYYSPCKNMWQDLDLDVIGMSAYFSLENNLNYDVLSVSKLKDAWRKVFMNYLLPIKQQNENKQIVFTEVGYIDSVTTSFKAELGAFKPRKFTDSNGNSFDDGEEIQRNIYDALFFVMKENPNILDGMFVWGEMISDNQTWNEIYRNMRLQSVRGKLAEEIISSGFQSIIPLGRSRLTTKQ